MLHMAAECIAIEIRHGLQIRTVNGFVSWYVQAIRIHKE